ncbi:MAG: DUF58 domain-containing protein [Lachnospiraceae bacterium]|nr:DUF58 domain-containing protein [Lachnospiraceae bacterium]
METNNLSDNSITAGEALFDAAFMDRTSRLRLAITKKSSLSYQGRRRSTLRGSSAEFSDYREYLPGDDVRRIDWNVYARLDRPYIREYMEERESAVNLFLDLTSSMGLLGKDVLAKRLAGALSVISLNNLDRVGLHIISGGRVDSFRFPGGKNQIRRALSMIEKAQCSGAGDLPAAVKSVPYLASGMSVLISDFCEESFLKNGQQLCRYLSYRKQEIIFLQILSGEELSPTDSGTFEMIDSEGTYAAVNIGLDEKTVSAYDAEMKQFLFEVKKIADGAGARYFLCNADEPYDRILFTGLRDIYDR